MQRALTALILAFAMLGAPAAALAQSAGDEQYVDPFQGEGGGGQQEQPAQQPELPAPPPSSSGDSAGQIADEAAPAPSAAPALPRTGLPVVIVAAAGYALLVAGIAIRRQT
jgi:hypothetical protein